MSKNTSLAPIQTFRNDLSKMDGEFSAALPPHIKKEKFMRTVMTAVQMKPDLLAADRQSLFESCMLAAQDGLIPDNRDAALVIFRTKKKVHGSDTWVDAVKYMPMVGGILKKVRNSGELATISPHVAYEHDVFQYVLGDDERITHEPRLTERGKPIAVYAIATLKTGEKIREVMTVADVEKVRAASRSKDAGPWKDWWEEMARKTVLRRLAKRLPQSTDLDSLIERDNWQYPAINERASGELGQPRDLNKLLDLEPNKPDEPAAETGDASATIEVEVEVDAES